MLKLGFPTKLIYPTILDAVKSQMKEDFPKALLNGIDNPAFVVSEADDEGVIMENSDISTHL